MTDKQRKNTREAIKAAIATAKRFTPEEAVELLRLSLLLATDPPSLTESKEQFVKDLILRGEKVEKLLDGETGDTPTQT